MNTISIHPESIAAALDSALDAIWATNPAKISVQDLINAVLKDSPDWQPATEQIRRQVTDLIRVRYDLASLHAEHEALKAKIPEAMTKTELNHGLIRLEEIRAAFKVAADKNAAAKPHNATPSK